MKRASDVFSVYGSFSVNSSSNVNTTDIEMGLAPGSQSENTEPTDLTALLASKCQIYSGPDGAIAAFNIAMHKKIIKALEGDYSRPLSALGLLGQIIGTDKGFAVQLVASTVLGGLTAYFYIKPAFDAATFLGNNIKWLTIFLQAYFVSAGPGLNCALGCLSIKKLIDVFRDELTDEEAFLRGKVNLSAFEKLIDNAKNITDVIFAIFATFAPVLLGTVGVIGLTNQILGAISGVTNLGPNWLGMNSITYPTLGNVVPLRKAQLVEAQYLHEQLRLLTEFPADDLLAKIYLIREEICPNEGKKLSEQDYLKLFLHLLQLGKKVDAERKEILLKKYPLTYFISSKKNSAPESQPLLVDESLPPAADLNRAENNKPDKERIDLISQTIPTNLSEKNSTSAEIHATILYQNPSTKMKVLVKYLLGAISAIAPLGYVLFTKNGINKTINKEFNVHLAWPGFIAAVGALLPFLGLGLGAGLGVGEGLTTDGKKLAEIAYPKIYAVLKWIIVILGLGSGGTNAEVNYQNFPTEITPPPTTAPGTTSPAGGNSHTDFDSHYPSTSQFLRYIAGGWGLAACPITNIYFTLELMEEVIVYVARNCSNPESRLIIETMLSIASTIKLRQQTTLPHYESILKRTVIENNETSADISNLLRGILADRLSPNDYFNRDINNSVGMIIPRLQPTVSDKFEFKPKKIYTESPCQTFFSKEPLGSNELRRRTIATSEVIPAQLSKKAEEYTNPSNILGCNVM